MIFLTVGNELPFPRLVKTIDQFCEKQKDFKVFGQIGHLDKKGYKPRWFDFKEFVSPEEYQQKCEDAELIIGHAGMGTIITGLFLSKTVLIMPRRASLGEHRNDHQVATCEEFAKRKGIFVAEDGATVLDYLTRRVGHLGVSDIEGITPFAEERLIKTIRDFIVSE